MLKFCYIFRLPFPAWSFPLQLRFESSSASKRYLTQFYLRSRASGGLYGADAAIRQKQECFINRRRLGSLRKMLGFSIDWIYISAFLLNLSQGIAAGATPNVSLGPFDAVSSSKRVVEPKLGLGNGADYIRVEELEANPTSAPGTARAFSPEEWNPAAWHHNDLIPTKSSKRSWAFLRRPYLSPFKKEKPPKQPNWSAESLDDLETERLITSPIESVQTEEQTLLTKAPSSQQKGKLQIVRKPHDIHLSSFMRFITCWNDDPELDAEAAKLSKNHDHEQINKLQ
ncbi:hypothetical protein O181_052638 [Austropuccinia psidii MF-1]|uniref:Uncharacterized protein n=1 Tax=Austropuccinia psidii MF-1 TaxID=1389203 RepID=A0A9Q3E5W3_9BASI|nr:hypothetical protein [Austropuccinia psidii MF-1]